MSRTQPQHSACAQVLSRFQDVQIVTWECSLQNALPWEQVDHWLQVQSSTAKFMATIFRKSAAYDKVSHGPCLLPDANGFKGADILSDDMHAVQTEVLP